MASPKWRVGLRKWLSTGIVSALLLLALGWKSVLYEYEDAMFNLYPSASLAAQYGMRHFSSGEPMLYDIGRAEYFYTRVVAVDPEYPYAFHQLARIAFLRGDFQSAIYYINKEIALHGESEPNTYYVRGLIEGYMGKYDDAVRDYEHYLKSDPNNWAAVNDYAWVLLKAKKPQGAADATKRALALFPDNPWLLNTNAIALYELGDLEGARASVERAQTAVTFLTKSQWLTAYPGNDPKIAGEGIATLTRSIADNMHSIEVALASSTVQ